MTPAASWRESASSRWRIGAASAQVLEEAPARLQRFGDAPSGEGGVEQRRQVTCRCHEAHFHGLRLGPLGRRQVEGGQVNKRCVKRGIQPWRRVAAANPCVTRQGKSMPAMPAHPHSGRSRLALRLTSVRERHRMSVGFIAAPRATARHEARPDTACESRSLRGQRSVGQFSL